MLIKILEAGLFSAIVAAFIMDGYKTLVGNSGDTTVFLLTQISLQLAEISSGRNSSGFIVAAPPEFTPAKSAVACNIFWFTSLGLSLSCALIATLLGQWAQNFLHRAEMHSGTPVIAARIMSYLYYGIRRFNMHAVVAVIPLLLHASLFFFFAGLVAFLIPVHLAVMGVCSGILFILPIRYHDCPYRTPLSGTLWYIATWYRRILQSRSAEMAQMTHTRGSSPQNISMVDAMTREATSDTDERANRDSRALGWTVKSLVDDNALRKFVECIPGLLEDDPIAKHTAQRRYREHIKRLIDDPEIQLYVRIQGMVHNPEVPHAPDSAPVLWGTAVDLKK
jgi:ABC-type multidrug transport system fused ATPase/permease subunit